MNPNDHLLLLLESAALLLALAALAVLLIRLRRHGGLEETQRLAALVYRNSRDAMMITDREGHILDVNPAFTQVTGYSREEALGRTPAILKSGRQSQEFYRGLWQALESGGHWEGEIWNRRKDGELYPQWLSIDALRDGGTAMRWVAHFSDITDKKNAEQLIWRQANFDSLTGLPNRQMFHDRLDQEIRKAQRGGTRAALMFLDLDHFKEVNDTLGHDVGDLLLQQTARRLKECVRESDTIARLGGDEFVIILPDLRDGRAVGDVAQKVLWQLARPYNLKGEVVYISTSIGITLYPDDAATPEELLKYADQAMYNAKKDGRNRYRYFTPAMQQAALERMRLANDLRGALDRREFWIAWQPVVKLSDGSINGAEALLRWAHPEKGGIPPAAFIPVAEDTGLLHDIGDWTFREVVRQLKEWRRINPGFRAGINKSPIQFRQNVQDSWLAHLQEVGLPGNGLVIEINESLLLNAKRDVREQLLAYRDAGVQVAVDDFGTGYSSLSYLKKFDIDYLKIDSVFVQNLSPDSEDKVLCEAIISMSHRLGIEVVAEGIETAVQRDMLRAMGCDYGQGYLFARPLAAADLEALIRDGQLAGKTSAQG